MLLDLAIQISKRRIKAFPCPHISVPKIKSLEVVEDSTVAVARARQVLSIEQSIEIVFVGKMLFFCISKTVISSSISLLP